MVVVECARACVRAYVCVCVGGGGGGGIHTLISKIVRLGTCTGL